jgi:regulatory protein
MGDADPAAAIECLALKLLATREHSRLELERKLRARGYAADAVEPVLAGLAGQGAINEARLAQAYVAERVGKGFGPLRIRAELRDKGLSDEAIDPHLEGMQDDWPQLLAQTHDRRFGPVPPTDQADYGRRGRFLEGRGFPSELIRRHLRWND